MLLQHGRVPRAAALTRALTQALTRTRTQTQSLTLTLTLTLTLAPFRSGRSGRRVSVSCDAR